jgi:rubrerythrin
MLAPRTIRSTEELFAHAIAMEREAAVRYRALAERMRECRNAALARLFLRFAELELEHQLLLERRARGLALPAIDRDALLWHCGEAPEALPADLNLDTLDPAEALKLALAAERRALAFYQSVRLHATDPLLCALAAELAAEEEVHVEWIRSAMKKGAFLI